MKKCLIAIIISIALFLVLNNKQVAFAIESANFTFISYSKSINFAQDSIFYDEETEKIDATKLSTNILMLRKKYYNNGVELYFNKYMNGTAISTDNYPTLEDNGITCTLVLIAISLQTASTIELNYYSYSNDLSTLFYSQADYEKSFMNLQTKSDGITKIDASKGMGDKSVSLQLDKGNYYICNNGIANKIILKSLNISSSIAFEENEQIKNVLPKNDLIEMPYPTNNILNDEYFIGWQNVLNPEEEIHICGERVSINNSNSYKAVYSQTAPNYKLIANNFYDNYSENYILPSKISFYETKTNKTVYLPMTWETEQIDGEFSAVHVILGEGNSSYYNCDTQAYAYINVNYHEENTTKYCYYVENEPKTLNFDFISAGLKCTGETGIRFAMKLNFDGDYSTLINENSSNNALSSCDGLYLLIRRSSDNAYLCKAIGQDVFSNNELFYAVLLGINDNNENYRAELKLKIGGKIVFSSELNYYSAKNVVDLLMQDYSLTYSAQTPYAISSDKFKEFGITCSEDTIYIKYDETTQNIIASYYQD